MIFTAVTFIVSLAVLRAMPDGNILTGMLVISSGFYYCNSSSPTFRKNILIAEKNQAINFMLNFLLGFPIDPEE
jgi:hypothetical protein